MAVNPAMGTEHSVDAAARSIEGLFGSDELEGLNDLTEGEPEGESEEEVELSEDSVEEEPEGEVDDEDSVEAEPDVEEDDEPEATIESLSDVAEALDLPLEEVLANLKHTVKVDGESLEVTLSELQAGYQKDADYRQKTEALKREREALEAAAQERFAAFEQEHAQNAYILNTIEQQIASEFNSEEFTRLRHQNPQEWTAKRMELQERLQGLQNLKQEAASRYYQMQEQSKAEAQAKLAETVQKEAELLRQAVPNWGTETQQSINNFLRSDYGFTPEQLDQVYDHRLVKMAYEAMMYRQTQNKVQETTKKVKKAPKLVKPSASKPEGRVRQTEVRKLKGRLRKSGHINDAAALIERMI